MSILSVSGSIILTGSTLSLQNDETSPAANSFYGTNSGGTRGWYLLTSEGVNTAAGTTGGVLVNGGTAAVAGAITLSLAAALTGINSVTSAALSALTFGTASFGTAVTFASATGVPTFAAGAVFAGALSGITTIAASGIVTLSSTTASSSTTTGALICSGGLGVAGAAYIGGLLSPGVTSASATSWTTSGVQLRVPAATFTDSSTLASGTAASAVFSSFAVPTLAATNLTVTTTDAATVYIAGAPTAGTNQTITNAWALLVAAGNVKVAASTASTSTTTGAAIVSGGLGVAGAAYVGGSATIGSNSADSQIVLLGSTSGATGGASINIRPGGSSTIIALGNQSNILGGGYSAVPMFYYVGASLRFYSATGSADAMTLSSAGAVVLGSASSITAAASTDLTLAGGSSGASLVLGQSTAGVATITALSGGLTKSQAATTEFTITNADTTTGSYATQASFRLSVGGVSVGALKATNENLSGLSTKSLFLTTIGAFPIAFGLNSSATPSMLLSALGNLLIGGTTDITGSGGLKVFGTTAATAAGAGSLINAGGLYNSGIIWGASILNLSAVALSADVSAFTGTPRQFIFDSSANSVSAFVKGSATTQGSELALMKSRATDGTADATIVTGDTVGLLYFAGADGATFKTAAEIKVTAVGTIATNQVPGKIDLRTANGSGTVGSALYVDGSAQAAVVGYTTASTSTTTGALQVTGGAGVAGSIHAGLAGTSAHVLNGLDRVLTLVSDNTSANSLLRFKGAANNKYTIGFNRPAASDCLIFYDDANSVYLGQWTNVALTIMPTTDSTSVATGALVVSGGLGVAGNVISGGGQGWGVTSTATAAGTTTLTVASRVVQIFTGATTQTVQLPAANVMGAGVAVVYVIKNRSSGNVTISRAGTDTIDGATSYVLTGGLNQSVTLLSNGVDAWVVA